MRKRICVLDLCIFFSFIEINVDWKVKKEKPRLKSYTIKISNWFFSLIAAENARNSFSIICCSVGSNLTTLVRSLIASSSFQTPMYALPLLYNAFTLSKNDKYIYDTVYNII